MSEFKRIPPEQALALREQGAVVVDIRDPQAFAAGHISGATHLDNHSVAEFIRNADLDAPTLVVCYHGNSIQSAAAYLVGQGFSEVFHLKGGILKYLELVPEAESRFTGECFVFDERVSVTHGLKEGEAVLCRACRNPMMPEDAVGSLCRDCAEAAPEGAQERERQMELARARGDAPA